MRLIDVGAAPVRTVAVSANGRFVAAAAGSDTFGVFDWHTGASVLRTREPGPCGQIAFGPNGDWVVRGSGSQLRLNALNGTATSFAPPGAFAGGVVVTRDGKALLAMRTGQAEKTPLERWNLPGFRLGHGFGLWSPFRRLAMSPNGEYLAGIWQNGFELRYAASGGLDHRFRPFKNRAFSSVGFASFTLDSELLAFGWDSEIRILDLSTGTSKPVRATAPETRGDPPLGSSERVRDTSTKYRTPYLDGAFTGSGRNFATIEQPDRWSYWDTDARVWSTILGTDPACLLRVRDVKTWEVVREYDWNCGPLTCLAFTADGTAGVCGTADGRLVQFDVDE